MKPDLAVELGLGPRELVAFTGGGGKSTLLLSLSRQLEAGGHRLIFTTTTKMGLDQTVDRQVCWSPELADIGVALAQSTAVMVLSDADDHKVLGYPPERVDDWFAHAEVEYVLVEADGARRRPLKAPAGHEPVIPSSTSLVVVVVGIDAIGQTIDQAVHRSEQAATLTGLSPADLVTPEVVTTIVSHPDGGLQGVPELARVVVVLNRVGPESEAGAVAVRGALLATGRIDSVVLVPFSAQMVI